MKSNYLRSYALGIAAALMAIPMYASQSQPQQTNLVSANAVLMQGLNSKSIHDGQTVTAKLTSNVKAANNVDMPKGTVLTGKVEQVQRSYNNGNESKIGVVFNKARLNGREVPIKATLLAAYPPVPYNAMESPSSYMMIQPRHISSNAKIDQEPGTLSHVAMRSSVQSNVSGVFLSKNHSIDLHRGTRIQLAIAPQPNMNSSTMGG